MPSLSLDPKSRILVCGPPLMVLALADLPFGYGPMKGFLADAGYIYLSGL